ncbi:MAG: hypothetical protein ABJQ72_21380, partial [Nitratireductor sp.]
MTDETTLSEAESDTDMAADEQEPDKNEEEGTEAEAPEEEAAPEGDASENVVKFPVNATEHAQIMRMAEALMFAAAEPLDIDSIAARLP